MEDIVSGRENNQNAMEDVYGCYVTRTKMVQPMLMQIIPGRSILNVS